MESSGDWWGLVGPMAGVVVDRGGAYAGAMILVAIATVVAGIGAAFWTGGNEDAAWVALPIWFAALALCFVAWVQHAHPRWPWTGWWSERQRRKNPYGATIADKLGGRPVRASSFVGDWICPYCFDKNKLADFEAGQCPNCGATVEDDKAFPPPLPEGGKYLAG